MHTPYIRTIQCLHVHDMIYIVEDLFFHML